MPDLESMQFCSLVITKELSLIPAVVIPHSLLIVLALLPGLANARRQKMYSLGRLPKVDLIILEGENVRPSVRPSVRPQKFLRFQ